MRAALMSLALVAVAFGPSALADTNIDNSNNAVNPSDQQQPGELNSDQQQAGEVSEDTGTVSTANSRDVTAGTLKNENFSLKFEGGAVAFTDPAGSSTSRAVGGLGLDWNILNTVMGGQTTPIYLGAQTGILYSHLGSATSNFFGANPNSTVSDPGSNLLLFPADLKLGYDIGDNFRISAHGGGNVIYRSVASSLDFGPSSGVAGSVWRIYPNVGGDVDLGLGNSATLSLRPDVTLTPGSTLFTGTLGIGVALG